MPCSNGMWQKERKCNGSKMIRTEIHWVSLHALLINTASMLSKTYMHLYVCVCIYIYHANTRIYVRACARTSGLSSRNSVNALGHLLKLQISDTLKEFSLKKGNTGFIQNTQIITFNNLDVHMKTENLEAVLLRFSILLLYIQLLASHGK